MMINRGNSILMIPVFVYMLLSSVCIAQPEGNDTIYIDTEKDGQNNFENKTLRKNSIYFELFGNGGAYSIGYDMMFWEKNNFKLSIASGITFYNDYFIVSPQSNLLIGKKNHFELGLGYSFPFLHLNGRNISVIDHVLFFRIGYRYQRENSGVLFRIGFTPFIGGRYIEPLIMPWGGITIGWTF